MGKSEAIGVIGELYVGALDVVGITDTYTDRGQSAAIL